MLKFQSSITLTNEEIHLISKLDAELFFNNAKEIYVERPDKSFFESTGDNYPIAFWMLTGDENLENMPEPIYIIIEYRKYKFTKFERVHICRRRPGKYNPNNSIKERFNCNTFDVNQLKQKGFSMSDEYDYNTIAKFLNKELYEKYFEEYNSLGYGDRMFAGWRKVKAEE